MNRESPPSPEKVTKEQVTAAYKKFVEAGVKSPDDLDLNDPEVQAAHEVFYKWQAGLDADAGDDYDARQRANFEKNKIYIDAGFTDPEYLRDVLGWLYLDEGDAKKDSNNPARVQLRQDMADEMKKIRGMLKE